MDFFQTIQKQIIEYLDRLPIKQTICNESEHTICEESYLDFCFAILIRDLLDVLKTTDAFEKQKWSDFIRNCQKPNGFIDFNPKNGGSSARSNLAKSYQQTALGITVLELLDSDLRFPLFGVNQFNSVEILEEWLKNLNLSPIAELDSFNHSELKGSSIIGLSVLLNKALHDGLINADPIEYLKAWCDSQASSETGLWSKSNSDFNLSILFDVFMWTRLHVHYFYSLPYPTKTIKWLLEYQKLIMNEDHCLSIRNILIYLILGGIYPLITNHRMKLKNMLKKHLRQNHNILFSSSDELIPIDQILHNIKNNLIFPHELYFTKSNVFILYLYLACYAVGSKILSGYRYSLSGWKLNNHSIYSSFYPIVKSQIF